MPARALLHVRIFPDAACTRPQFSCYRTSPNLAAFAHSQQLALKSHVNFVKNPVALLSIRICALGRLYADLVRAHLSCLEVTCTRIRCIFEMKHASRKGKEEDRMRGHCDREMVVLLDLLPEPAAKFVSPVYNTLHSLILEAVGAVRRHRDVRIINQWKFRLNVLLVSPQVANISGEKPLATAVMG